MSEIEQLAQQFRTILEGLVAIFEKEKQAICRDDWELMQKNYMRQKAAYCPITKTL